MNYKLKILFPRFVIILFLLSCTLMKGPSPPPRYYILSGTKKDAFYHERNIWPNAIKLVIGPIEIPPYLDRTQIVTRVSRDELFVSNANRWAEPLSRGIERTLALDIYRLSDGMIVTYPFSQDAIFEAGKNGYRLLMDCYNFECSLNGVCNIRGLWRLFNISTGKKVMERRYFIEKNFPEGQASYQKVVMGMNRILYDLSLQIEEKILERFGD